MKTQHRQIYHANVPAGWANDPNGTIYYQGKAHMFYQHYPHDSKWGIMHWGHMTTEDFIHWEVLPIALIPEEEYEVLCGCCSGSAIEKDGKLYLMYTAAQPDLQRQCLAVSEDGIHFQKDEKNPVIDASMLHKEVAEADFRDPRMFEKDGVYYLIAGTRILDSDMIRRREASGSAAMLQKAEEKLERPVRSPSIGDVSGGDPEVDGYGNLILLKSSDLHTWEYVGKLLYRQDDVDKEYYRLDGVYECPDYLVIDGEEVLISSPQNLPQMGYAYQNLHSSIYMTGHLNLEDGHFEIRHIGEIDCGFDFYAAQTLQTPDKRVIMLAWKEMWDRSYPTQEEGWVGSYTLPRELHMRNGRLVQVPVREIEDYRKNEIKVDRLMTTDQSIVAPGIEGNVVELSFTTKPGDAVCCGIKVFKGKEHQTVIVYDKEQGIIRVDRSQSGDSISGREENTVVRYCQLGDRQQISMRVFLDVSSLEVFINEGEHVLTANVYPDPGDTGVEFFSAGGTALFEDIVKYDIVV